ncbi:unnamed protein product, partial [marine sediment metagenome]
PKAIVESPVPPLAIGNIPEVIFEAARLGILAAIKALKIGSAAAPLPSRNCPEMALGILERGN